MRMKRLLALFLAIAVAGVLAACSMSGGSAPLSPGISPQPDRQEANPDDDPLPKEDAFGKIVDAYAEMEAGGWKDYDEALLGDSYFAGLLDLGYQPDEMIQFAGYALNELSLRYALHDVSGDGVPELVIGAEWVEYDSVFITAVYIRSGDAAKAAANLSLRPYESIDLLNGNLIAASSGRMGYYEGYYVGFDEGEAYVADEWTLEDPEGYASPYEDEIVELTWKPLDRFAHE